MSFPPCTFHPAAWVSHTQMAPGVSSLSTTNGTESCLSGSQSSIRPDPEGLGRGGEREGGGKKCLEKKPSGYTNAQTPQIHMYTEGQTDECKNNRQGYRWEVSLRTYDKLGEIKVKANTSLLPSWMQINFPPLWETKRQRAVQCAYISSMCVDTNVTLRQQSEGALPLIEWTSGSPVVSRSLLRARWSSADCSLPPAATPHTYTGLKVSADRRLTADEAPTLWVSISNESALYNHSSALPLFTSPTSDLCIIPEASGTCFPELSAASHRVADFAQLSWSDASMATFQSTHY